MRDISRWLSTFRVKLSSEKTAKLVVKQWTGDCLRAELAPLTTKKENGKKVEVILKPWAYIYNLVGHVLRQLHHLKEKNHLVDYPFIKNDEIHLKIGGDHGDDSFKMEYQIGNVIHPNKKENTVIFSIFEAKDNRANLRICLDRFRSHVKKLQTVKFENRHIRTFMYGDYEFLCAMYGLSGPNGI